MPVLYLCSYDMPGISSSCEFLFWGQRNFPISFSSSDDIKCLKSSLRKLIGRSGDLVKQYEFPQSIIVCTILEREHTHWDLPSIKHYTNLRPCYHTGPGNRIPRGFHWIFATSLTCRLRRPVLSNLGLACILAFRNFAMMFSDWISIFLCPSSFYT